MRGGGTEGGPLHDQFDGPSAPRHATAPNHSRTSGAGCPTPARTDSHALPALGPPGSGSPPSPVADHASPAWRASLPARAAPAPARRRRPTAPPNPPRHDLQTRPPSFQVLSPNPSLPANGDPAPRLAGLISSPVRTHIGERPRKEGGGRLSSMLRVSPRRNGVRRSGGTGRRRTAGGRSPRLFARSDPRRETPTQRLPTRTAGMPGQAVAGAWLARVGCLYPPAQNSRNSPFGTHGDKAVCRRFKNDPATSGELARNCPNGSQRGTVAPRLVRYVRFVR